MSIHSSKGLKRLLVVAAMVGLLGLTSGQTAAQVVRYDDGPIILENDFLLDGRNWLPDTDLSYSFINFTPDLTQANVRNAIVLALNLWAAVTPLTFTEIADSGLPFNDANAEEPNAGNIRIQFAAGNHGDGNNFDGTNGVLAHAFFPPPNGGTAAGDAHFDEAESWTNQDRANSAQPMDLRTVAAHEFGHSLGLNHAQVQFCPDANGVSSLMCPFYTGSHNFLAQDDINGIQAIYGPGVGVIEGWKITAKNVAGDDSNFSNFTICLLDDGTFFLIPFCEDGRWFADGVRRWAQGGCTGFDPDLAFALDGDTTANKAKMTGFIHEFEVDASFVVGAFYTGATRNDVACESGLQLGTESVTGR